MDQCNLIELLGQASVSEAGDAFREFLRGGVRQMIADVMSDEVAQLCGVKYRPSEEGECQRAGTAPAGGEMVRASIVAAHGQLFIRTTRRLYCVGKEQ